MDQFFQLFLLAIIVALIIFYEVPPLLREKRWRDVTVFSVVLIIGTTMVGLWLVGIKIPAPFKALGVY